MPWRDSKDSPLKSDMEFEGFRVTITRSAGTDDAVVIFVDGPLYESNENPEANRDRDEINGSPRCRILLNDEPVYAAVPYEPREDVPYEPREE